MEMIGESLTGDYLLGDLAQLYNDSLHPNLTGYNETDTILPAGVKATIVVVYMIVCVVGLVGNCLVMYVIISSPSALQLRGGTFWNAEEQAMEGEERLKLRSEEGRSMKERSLERRFPTTRVPFTAWYPLACRESVMFGAMTYSKKNGGVYVVGAVAPEVLGRAADAVAPLAVCGSPPTPSPPAASPKVIIGVSQFISLGTAGVTGIFVFSLVWSVGASCDDAGRLRFDGVAREILAGPLSEDTRVRHGILASVEPPTKQLTVPLPAEGTLYQHRFQSNRKLTRQEGRYTKMKTATNIYIFNLALADALVLATLPFQGTDVFLGFWPFGNALCKGGGVHRLLNMFTSTFTLTVMSMDRYVAVCHPVKALDMRTPHKAKVVNICVWVLASAIGVPAMVMGDMKTATNIYIFNLALADALVLATLPFQGTDVFLGFWPFGNALCKAVVSIDYYNMFTSTFTLTVMSMDRYVAVCHPVKALDMRTPHKAKCIVVLPNPRAYWDPVFGTCVFLFSFLIPVAIISICYSLMVKRLRSVRILSGSKEKDRNLRRITRMVLVVVAAFVVCWTPVQIMALAQSLGFNLGSLFTLVLMHFCIALGYVNSSLNPVLYAFLDENFKRCFREFCHPSPFRLDTQQSGRMRSIAREVAAAYSCKGGDGGGGPGGGTPNPA
ncbi:hypothetical protein CRUP_035262 [Coryphaenoides rupestris]|nr:hypothetical protein CRUP_035262 [Coryphaenoides rupestris]